MNLKSQKKIQFREFSYKIKAFCSLLQFHVIFEFPGERLRDFTWRSCVICSFSAFFCYLADSSINNSCQKQAAWRVSCWHLCVCVALTKKVKKKLFFKKIDLKTAWFLVWEENFVKSVTQKLWKGETKCCENSSFKTGFKLKSTGELCSDFTWNQFLRL